MMVIQDLFWALVYPRLYCIFSFDYVYIKNCVTSSLICEWVCVMHQILLMSIIWRNTRTVNNSHKVNNTL